MRRFSNQILLTFLCISTMCVAHAKKYISTELQEIGNQLTNYSGGYYEVVDTVTGDICHIGVPMFQTSADESTNIVLRFIERMILCQKLLPLHDYKQMLADNKMSFQVSSYEYPIDSYTMNISDQAIQVIWESNTATFPNDYSLLLGMNKLETDSIFYSRLIPYHSKDVSLPEASSVDDDDEILTVAGNSYIIDEINSDKYYVKSSLADNNIPVYCKNYPSESVANLMQMLLDNNIDIDITQRLYGYKKMEYRKKLNDLTAFCKENDCKIYVGIESIEDNVIKAVVVYKNNIFSFNHLLYINLDLSLLDKKTGTIKGEIYTFIPTHNIKNLYDDK